MFLVTGATGFIGGHLVEKLCASGVPVRALVRRVDREWPCSTAVCDLAGGSGLEPALEGVDTVIHLAGATKALNPQDYFRANVRASANLARALEGRPVRLVHVSSLAAVGPGGEPRGGSLPEVDESTEPRPVSQYGRSKLEGERAVRALRPDAVIVRPPVVYGPRDTDVFRILKCVSRGWSLQIGGESWFSAVYVHDLVDGLIGAAHGAPPGTTYFMAHTKPNSWTGLASAAARIMRIEPRTLRVPLPAAFAAGYCAEIWAQVTRRPGIISRDKIAEAQYPYWVCDSRRAAAELGWQAATSLENGLAETLAWYKEAGWLKY